MDVADLARVGRRADLHRARPARRLRPRRDLDRRGARDRLDREGGGRIGRRRRVGRRDRDDCGGGAGRGWTWREGRRSGAPRYAARTARADSDAGRLRRRGAAARPRLRPAGTPQGHRNSRAVPLLRRAGRPKRTPAAARAPRRALRAARWRVPRCESTGRPRLRPPRRRRSRCSLAARDRRTSSGRPRQPPAGPNAASRCRSTRTSSLFAALLHSSRGSPRSTFALCTSSTRTCAIRDRKSSPRLHYGDDAFFFDDANADPEPGGFWVRGASTARIAVAASPGARQLKLRLHGGGAGVNHVRLETSSWSRARRCIRMGCRRSTCLAAAKA